MGSIAIVGLGAGEDDALTEDTLARLGRVSTVVVSSPEGPIAERLRDEGVRTVPLEELGLAPDMTVERIVEELVTLAHDGDVAYVASGYPLLREGMVSTLLARSRGSVDVFPVISPLQVLLLAFDIDLTADLDIIDVRSLRPSIAQRDSHLIVTGVRNRMLARIAAERLAEVYPLSHAVVVAGCQADGTFSLHMRRVLDMAEGEFCDDAAVFVAPASIDPPTGFDEFVRTIGELRGPDGCPWDRAQDHMSLRTNMIEEAYEAVAAIESGEPAQIADELGDVLLQVVLHAQIASDSGTFNMDDVVEGIARKIRRRHPHVFGTVVAETPDEVHRNWDDIKRQEKADSAVEEISGTLDGIAHTLPSLMYAQKMSRRAVAVGFEWETLDDVWDKVHEEIDELKETQPGSPEAVEEIGDLLFTVVNLARKQGIDAETALRSASEKFRGRFEQMERSAIESGTSIEKLGLSELESLWNKAKSRENKSEGADRS